ncbi:MAG TPA: hypothetical protein VF721_08010 [Pyrinomonadaceae bacterium]|jgi:hypothetical protein
MLKKTSVRLLWFFGILFLICFVVSGIHFAIDPSDLMESEAVINAWREQQDYYFKLTFISACFASLFGAISFYLDFTGKGVDDKNSLF